MSANDSSSTTRSIVKDYFNWRLKTKTITNNRLFLIVRNIAYDSETTYDSLQPIFNFHFSSLIYFQNVHYEIAKELFNDGIITWTRIITFISFSAILAEHFIQQPQQQQNMDLIISSIIDWTTNFIDKDLQTWLENQNYWVSAFKLNIIYLISIFSRLDF